MKRNLVIGAVLALSACGSVEVFTASIGAPIPPCAEVPVLRAPDDAYSDTPRYVANEMPIDEIRAWAVRQPGFESIWIDRERNGWVTLAFSEAAAERQAEVREQFPGAGVVTIEVPWRMSDLRALQARIHDELGFTTELGSGIADNRGVVEIQVAVLTDEIRDEVTRRFRDQPVCLDGSDPSDWPHPGPQPNAGEGWRLLADEPGVGEPYRTGIATDPESLRTLWSAIGLDGPVPEVDFQSEVVIWFGAVYGSSCPELRLDDVVVEGSMVYAQIVLTRPHIACTDDANPRAYVVAVQRSILPKGPFAIQLSRQDPPAGAPEERTIVDADLTVPGAVAAPGQVGRDPALPQPESVAWGDFLEPGFPMGPYHLYVHCGVEWLGEFNGYTWRTAEELPDEWLALMTPDQYVPVTLLLSTDPEPVIEATAGGLTVTYRVTDERDPGCD